MALVHVSPERVEERRQRLHSLKAEADAHRNFPEIVADDITRVFGSFWFALSHVIWFVFWILINTGRIPGLAPFDPFPFGLLTMIVSLEAIFLSIFVLISQNRSQKIADLREEINLQIVAQAEEEITETLHLVNLLTQHFKIKVTDREQRRVHRFEQDFDKVKLKHQIEKEI